MILKGKNRQKISLVPTKRQWHNVNWCDNSFDYVYKLAVNSFAKAVVIVFKYVIHAKMLSHDVFYKN